MRELPAPYLYRLIETSIEKQIKPQISKTS
jgi:hypothetical protein